MVENGSSTWVCFGVVDGSVVDKIGGSFADVVDDLRSTTGEFNLLRVKNDHVRRVDAYRDVTSSYELYTTVSSNGEVVITDTFRDAVACLDVPDRTVSESALADHYLFRTTLGTNTYIDEIDRLGHGQRLEWHPETDRKTVMQCRRLSVPPETNSTRDTLSQINTTLQTIYDRIQDRSKTPFVTMLSGGIDSTLLQTYSPTAESMSVNVTAPEFESEVEYAVRASELTDSSHTLVELDESSFLDALIATTETLAKPPHHLQKVFWDAAFKAGDWQTYATGIFGDSWFGEPSSTVAAITNYAPALFDSPATKLGQRLLPGRFTSYAATLADTAEQLRRPISHPLGLANSHAFYGSPAIARTVASKKTIDNRLNDRFRYVTRVVDLPITGETSALGAHLEFGHLTNYYMSNSGQLGRQLAQNRGVTLFTPFTDRRLAEVALTVPSPDRFLDGLTSKHYLKSLLQRRVPAYDTSKPKKAGGLPTQRWLTDGPFAEALAAYGLPGHLPDTVSSDLLENPRMDTWNALCFRIWEEHVLLNPEPQAAFEARQIRV